MGEIEHLHHLFFECRFAKDCWGHTGIAQDMWNIENASDWLLGMLSEENEDKLVRISLVLWGVWFARNKLIFEGRSITPATTMKWSMQ